MDRWHSSRSSLVSLACALVALAASACVASGPPIVEHPRSGSMTLVSPEIDPLAGTPIFVSSGATRASDPLPAIALDPPPAIGTLTPSHVSLHGAAWSLALGPDETAATVAPEIALSEALSMSAGPAPHLSRAPLDVVVVSVSEVAVEEGAWEARRR